MPEFSPANLVHILLGLAPGTLLGMLVGYWYQHATQFVRPALIERLPRAHQPAPVQPVNPVAIVADALAVAANARGNVNAPDRTEQGVELEPAAGLNAYGEVINPHE